VTKKKKFLKLRKQIRAVLGQEAVVKTLAAVNKPSRFLITKKIVFIYESRQLLGPKRQLQGFTAFAFNTQMIHSKIK
jgi:hypothetical protein